MKERKSALKLSVFYDHLNLAARQSGMTVAQVLAEVKRAGVDAVDISADDLACGEITAALAQTGLAVASVFREYDWTGGEYGSETRLREHIDAAAAFGAESVLMVPGYLPPEEGRALRTAGENTAQLMSGSGAVLKTAEMLRTAVQYGRQKGVAVTLEDFDNALSPCAGLHELLWYLQNVPGLKITFDTGNFAFVGQSVLQALERLGESVVRVHVKDRTAAGANAAAGSGVVPVDRCAAMLRDLGYAGYYTVEHDALPQQLAAVMKSAQYLKSL